MHATGIRRTFVAIAALGALTVSVPIATADHSPTDGYDSGNGTQHRPGSGHGQRHGRRVIDAAIARHLANVENCDAQGLVDDYTRNARVFFPDGVVVNGRAELKTLYGNFVKPLADGGLCGIHLKVLDQFRQHESAIVKVEVTADFLSEPYISTDSYVFRNGRISAEVSTLDGSKLKFK